MELGFISNWKWQRDLDCKCDDQAKVWCEEFMRTFTPFLAFEGNRSISRLTVVVVECLHFQIIIYDTALDLQGCFELLHKTHHSI
jgi:hypothetical protein